MARPVKRRIPEKRPIQGLVATGLPAPGADSMSDSGGQSADMPGQPSAEICIHRDSGGTEVGTTQSSAVGAAMVIAGERPRSEVKAEINAVVQQLEAYFETPIGHPVRQMLRRVAVAHPDLNLWPAVEDFLDQFEEDPDWCTSPVGYFHDYFPGHAEFLDTLNQGRYAVAQRRAEFAQEIYDSGCEALERIEENLAAVSRDERPPHYVPSLLEQLAALGFAKAVPEDHPHGYMIRYPFRMLGKVLGQREWTSHLKDPANLRVLHDRLQQYLEDGDLSAATGKYDVYHRPVYRPPGLEIPARYLELERGSGSADEKLQLPVRPTSDLEHGD